MKSKKTNLFPAYRYGFNGKENDNEVKGEGNSIDFGARIYDSRLGRWLSTDPLTYKREWLSPYNFVQNNPINRIDPSGALDEYTETVNLAGKTTKTKISDLGGNKVDFTHIIGGKQNGQTRITSRGTGKEVYMKSSKDIFGFTRREGGVGWDKLFDEFTSGTGPENSLIIKPAMLQDLIKSEQFIDATQAYMDAGAPEKMSYKPSFTLMDAYKIGSSNMTMQFVGKAAYSFYNVGDNLVISIMDSKSVVSYSFNPLIKILPESWYNKDRLGKMEIPNSTTRQTYFMILPIKK